MKTVKSFNPIVNLLCLVMSMVITFCLIKAPSSFYQAYVKEGCDWTVEDCWADKRWAAIAWNTFSRSGWILGIAFFFIPCLLGNLNFVRLFLGADLFTPLSRLQYSVYLIHVSIILWLLFFNEHALYLSNINMAYFSLGVLVFSTILSVPFSLFCEVPYMTLEKIWLMPQKKKTMKVVDMSLNRDTTDESASEGLLSSPERPFFKKGINASFASDNDTQEESKD